MPETITKKETINHFGQLTPMMNCLRDSIIDAKPYVDPERAILTTETYKAHQDEQVDILRAKMLQNVLSKMTIFIEDNTLLAGHLFSLSTQ